METVATNELASEFVDCTTEIDNFENAAICGDLIILVFVEIIKELLGRFNEHYIIGMKVIMCELEHFLIHDKRHNDLK